MAEVLPYVALEWTKPTEGDYDFVSYKVYRDEVSADGLIAVLDDIDVPEYDDYLAPPGEHTWYVSWVGDLSGAVIESDADEATATLSADGIWLHDVADPDEQVRLRSTDLTRDGQQAQERRLVGVSQAPVTFVGRAYYDEFDLTLRPEDFDDPTVLEQVWALALRQKTSAAVYCLRLMQRADARWFVNLSGRGERGVPNISRGSIRMVEAHFDEAGAADA